MRKLFILILSANIICVSCFAKIWRVNNNTGISADFTTLQDAHDGAASGDTLYLESSPASYGTLNCSKKLIIIGTGYFLDQNQGLQASALPSKVNAITFNTGSSGSIIEGVSTLSNDINIYANDIIVRRNYFGNTNGTGAEDFTGTIGIYTSVNNIFITQNYALIIVNNAASTGILISNNYLAYGGFAGDATPSQNIQLHQNTVAIIKNNIFGRGTVTAYNSNISNNIMYNGFLAGSGNIISHNLGNGTQFGSLNGNKSNVNMATVFELAGSSDAAWKLKSGSPAIGAGEGSTPQNRIDAGMYWGSISYVLSGLPAIPSIYFLTNQPVGSNGDPIDVQVKVKSNN